MKKVNEDLADLAMRAESDHEVQMARAELYKIAKYAIKLHDMLKTVSEREGLDGWVQSKITKSADYIGSVYHHLDYEMKFESVVHEDKQNEAFGKKDMSNMVDLVKGVLKNPLRGDKEAKKANKKHGRDLAGRDIKEADMDFGDKTKELSMWLAKYDEYKGTNGDALPMGWIKAMTSTGVMSDGYEQDELIAFEKKIGKEEMEWEDDDYKEFRKPENSPITNKMYDELAKIIGTKDRGEEVADAVASALGMGESVEDSVQSYKEDIAQRLSMAVEKYQRKTSKKD